MRLILLALVAISTSCMSAQSELSYQELTVERIIDGDTLVASGKTVRLIGVDTPETVKPGTEVQCYGPEASNYLEELLPVGSRVKIETDVEPMDRYERNLGYLYRANDNLFINEDLVVRGYARLLIIGKNRAHEHELRLAEAAAKRAAAGVWGAC